MLNKKNILFTKNLFGYEHIIPPPSNLPDNMHTLYLTDSESNKELALSMGWDEVIVTHEFSHITDNFGRRSSIGYINSHPHKFIKNILDYNFVFMIDSNVQSFWVGYDDFVSSCSNEHALYVTTRYYPVGIDNLHHELIRSNQDRWRYNFSEIKNSTEFYMEDLQKDGVDVDNLNICSAKYFGWNPHHKMYLFLTNFMYSEHKKHIQGNIVLTYLLGKYPNYIFNYKNNQYVGGSLTAHNYNA
jgi:hypothetical protein